MNEQYVTPREVEDQGYRRSHGRVYKMNTLERYAAAGYLDYGNFSATDKVSAGNRLYTDFYLGGLCPVGSSDIARIRVDGCGKFDESDGRLYHRHCYELAMAAVPQEFWPVVRRVCVEDEPLNVRGAGLFVRKELYALRRDLNRGLERLVGFYKKKRMQLLKSDNK